MHKNCEQQAERNVKRKIETGFVASEQNGETCVPCKLHVGQLPS